MTLQISFLTQPVDWINLAQSNFRWRAVLHTAVKYSEDLLTSGSTISISVSATLSFLCDNIPTISEDFICPLRITKYEQVKKHPDTENESLPEYSAV
jgi:hypothetical protein